MKTSIILSLLLCSMKIIVSSDDSTTKPQSFVSGNETFKVLNITTPDEGPNFFITRTTYEITDNITGRTTTGHHDACTSHYGTKDPITGEIIKGGITMDEKMIERPVHRCRWIKLLLPCCFNHR